MLDDDDARIVAQGPVDLPVADVERDDARGAALEQDVGEAAGGGADIQRLAAVDGDGERVERVRELQPAAADVRMVWRDQRDVRGRIDLCAGFRVRLAVNADLAGQNQRARPLARRRQPFIDNELVEPNAQFLQP